ncbi:hypothetical protein Pdw03_0516 [Penicillium digitatum]|uniref:Uncharacterized protein n=3 Tax=Penicillium digitatum TaxID=36651 RepID=K9FWU7_PEND2|nr:hypothetical protein PDIP_86920 [Penicillium digitatum Pd1]EKV04535.1 hypothetical protein PDIP_86920 [Penicillium digitatum Pd1]EKV05516.1 hypothetical protein PDIG_83140 [Penicillium digitatum PHI26]QQK45618.1 hypothetical protein Pdw03_0516 [Penicillium digitatum]
MEKPKVIGPDGLSPISLQRQADVRITTEVIYDVITNCKMISLEESVHAPVAVRNKARADRIAGVQTVSSCLNSRRFAQLEDKKAAASRVTASRIPAPAQKHLGIDPRAKPFVPAATQAAGLKDEVARAPMKMNPGEAIDGPNKATPDNANGERKDADNNSVASSKASRKAESTEDKESIGSPPKPRGLTAPADFMKQVRLLHLQKQMAPKVVPAGPPRRVVFGNLPEWANVSSILQLVYGGIIERAWGENGEVVVQFVEQDDCVKYYENHSDGIQLKDGDDDLTISVTMPEEGLSDNVELSIRVEEGASRVICLSGLPTGFKTSDNDNVLGIAADPVWHSKSFERILIKQAESGVDVQIFFYDLHDGWDVLQSIKEGAYDCTASFEVDPCALAEGFHFMDEPNLMFSGILAVD